MDVEHSPIDHNIQLVFTQPGHNTDIQFINNWELSPLFIRIDLIYIYNKKK